MELEERDRRSAIALSWCNYGDKGGKQTGELALDTQACLHDLFVVDGFVEDAGGHVGDQREAEDFDSHVAGDDDLVDRRHADEVGSKSAEGADLCGGLIAGAEDGKIDAFGEEDVLFRSFGLSHAAQSRRVGSGHVEKAGTESCFVGTEGGVRAGEVDMVGYGHKRALFIAGVDSPGGIGDDERFAAEEAEDASGEGDFGERVALVSVDAALHDGDWDSGDVAEDKLAGVAFDGGLREVRNLGVRNGGRVFDLRGEVAEAGAEDDAEARCERGE